MNLKMLQAKFIFLRYFLAEEISCNKEGVIRANVCVALRTLRSDDTVHISKFTVTAKHIIL